MAYKPILVKFALRRVRFSLGAGFLTGRPTSMLSVSKHAVLGQEQLLLQAVTIRQVHRD